MPDCIGIGVFVFVVVVFAEIWRLLVVLAQVMSDSQTKRRFQEKLTSDSGSPTSITWASLEISPVVVVFAESCLLLCCRRDKKVDEGAPGDGEVVESDDNTRNGFSRVDNMGHRLNLQAAVYIRRDLVEDVSSLVVFDLKRCGFGEH